MLKKIIVFLVLLTVFFVSSRSFFRNDFFYMHDFTHGARIVEMNQALKDGHFPVRWSSDFGFGFGMPLFEFYAPLPYYVGSLVYSLGFSLVNSIKSLFVIANLVTIIGGYLLGKKLFGRFGGLVVTTALTLAPYRAVNLFVRGAVSEIWGIMALPFILLGIIAVVKKEKNGWIILLFSLVTLMLSHNLTTMMFIPFSIVFGAVYLLLVSIKQKKWPTMFINRILVFLGVYLLSIALSSFYLIPALLEKGYTRVESTILGGYFDYNLHFVSLKQFFQVNWKYGGSSFGPNDEMSFYLGFAQLLALVLSGFLFVNNFIKTRKRQKLKKLLNSKLLNKDSTLYLLVVTLLGVSLFMTLYKSKFIWDSIDVLKFIQFPWRWLSVAIIFLSLSSGYLISFIRTEFNKYLLALFLIFFTLFLNWKFFQPEKYYQDSSNFYYSDREKIRERMSKVLPDFIPVQMKDETLRSIVRIDQLLDCDKSENNQTCEFEFQTLINQTQKKLIIVNLQKDTLIEFSVADFPGWQVRIDGEKVDHKVSDSGVIEVLVKKGKHKIGLSFENSKIRSIADLISFFSLVVFLSIFFWYHRSK